jgi:hypothetical protein
MAAIVKNLPNSPIVDDTWILLLEEYHAREHLREFVFDKDENVEQNYRTTDGYLALLDALLAYGSPDRSIPYDLHM